MELLRSAPHAGRRLPAAGQSCTRFVTAPLRRRRRVVVLGGSAPSTVGARRVPVFDLPERPISALSKAIDHGFGHWRWIENDTDLDSIRQEPEFANLLARKPESAPV